MQCHETVTYVFHSSLAGWKMVEVTFVRRDAGPAKVAIESKRNVLIMWDQAVQYSCAEI